MKTMRNIRIGKTQNRPQLRTQDGHKTDTLPPQTTMKTMRTMRTINTLHHSSHFGIATPKSQIRVRHTSVTKLVSMTVGVKKSY